MKIGIFYNTIDQPWGGINTFFRNFVRAARKSKKVELVEDFSDADIILTAGHYRGPGQTIKPMQLVNISNSKKLYNPLGLFSKKGDKKIVFRVDGLRSHYTGGISTTDKLLIDNLEYADGIVFQSKFSMDCFKPHLNISTDNTGIILNGADQNIFFPEEISMNCKDTVKIVSSSWSVNSNKGFDIISAVSQIDKVSVCHIGKWPKETAIENVKLLGVMTEQQLAAELRKHHFLLFPSKNEACSNTVTEALCSGLPVLYHHSGGTTEQCGINKYGLPIPDSPSGIDMTVLTTFIDQAVENYTCLRKNILDESHSFHFSYCFESYIAYFSRLLDKPL